MVSYRFGGADGVEVQLEDGDDVVVVRTHRRGARHDVSPLSGRSRMAHEELRPLFGFPTAGVGVYEAPEGRASELASLVDEDTAVRFAGRGLRDELGAPVVYTENIFIKFVDEAKDPSAVLEDLGLHVERSLPYAGNAFFAKAEEGIGREVFALAAALLERDDVELCHPEIVREITWNAAFPPQWHLQPATIGEHHIDAHCRVVDAWELSEGDDIVIAVVDDGVDVDHDEFAGGGKIVAPAR